MTDEIKTIRRSLENASSFDEFKDNMLSSIGFPQHPASSTRSAADVVEENVSETMFRIGVPANILGFRYLCRAISMAVLNDKVIDRICDGLYVDIAKEYDSTPSRVERAIRHAIEVAWSRGDIDYLAQFFGNTVSPEKGRTTNSQFIAIVADKIRRELKNRPQRCER